MEGAKTVSQNVIVQHLVRAYLRENKIVGMICAGGINSMCLEVRVHCFEIIRQSYCTFVRPSQTASYFSPYRARPAREQCVFFVVGEYYHVYLTLYRFRLP